MGGFIFHIRWIACHDFASYPISQYSHVFFHFLNMRLIITERSISIVSTFHDSHCVSYNVTLIWIHTTITILLHYWPFNELFNDIQWNKTRKIYVLRSWKYITHIELVWFFRTPSFNEALPHSLDSCNTFHIHFFVSLCFGFQCCYLCFLFPVGLSLISWHENLKITTFTSKCLQVAGTIIYEHLDSNLHLEIQQNPYIHQVKITSLHMLEMYHHKSFLYCGFRAQHGHPDSQPRNVRMAWYTIIPSTFILANNSWPSVASIFSDFTSAHGRLIMKYFWIAHPTYKAPI